MALILKSATSANEANISTAGSLQVLPNHQFNTTPPAPANGTEVAPQADSAGSLFVNNEGRKATYRCYLAAGSLPVTGILYTLVPSGTKTVKITRVRLYGSQTTAAIVGFQLQKHSTGFTGGTVSGTGVSVPLDAADPASTVTIKSYSVVPAGTSIGQVDQVEVLLHSATTMPAMHEEMAFGSQPGTKELVLTGTQCASLATANSLTSAFLNIVFEWTEE